MIATYDSACDEFALNSARDAKERGEEQRAWILTPYDTWVRNPFYRGPAVPHPDDDRDDDEDFFASDYAYYCESPFRRP